MTRSVALLMLVSSACGPYAFTQASVEVTRGSTVFASVTGPPQGAAPEFTVEPVAPERGLTVSIGKVPPNPKAIRGVVSIAAAADAPLGKTRVTVTGQEGATSLEVDVKASAELRLTPMAAAVIAVSTNEVETPQWFFWVTQSGGVRQRVEGVETLVPGLTDVRSVAAKGPVAWAVTESGSLVKWSPLARPITISPVLQGVREVTACQFASLALMLDGAVVDLDTMLPVSDLTDVVAIRVSGFSQQIINGGGTYVSTSRFFLRRDGSVERWATIRYVQGQLPDTSMRERLAGVATDVSSAGFIRNAAGLVTLNGALLHEFPAKALASPPRTASQSNSTTFSSSNSCYVLFDDGALWLTSVSKTTGENQQGAPVSSANASQVAVRAPGDEDIDSFLLLGSSVLVTTRSGAMLITGASMRGFEPVSFNDLRR